MSMSLESVSIATKRLKLNGLWNGVSSGIPVIALHGWLDNAASFIPLSKKLSLNQPFYAIDMPGHGHSEHRPQSASYSMIENVLDVAALVNEIAPSGAPVVLLGHSLGGIICSLFAAASPERVTRMVLLDSLGPMVDDASAVLGQLRKATSKISAFRASTLTVYPTLDDAANARTSGFGKLDLAAARILVERGSRAVKGGFSWTSDSRLMEPSLLRLSESQVEAIFNGIECPVSLICGSEGYFSNYEKFSKRLAYIRDLSKYQVAGGHHFHMDGDVEATAGLISEFIHA